MNDFKKKFSDYTSEHLLTLRARGDDLSDDAHHAIEEIFRERDEYLPPKPSSPIHVSITKDSGSKNWVATVGLVLFMLFVSGLVQQFAHTWFGFVIAVPIVFYMIYKKFSYESLSPEEKNKEDTKRKIEGESLSEIMVCSAEGDLNRIRELVEYGGDVNRKSLSGNTALMYAVRNNRVDVVRYLLSVGADRNIRSDKKITALDLAKRHEFHEIVTLLEQ